MFGKIMLICVFAILALAIFGIIKKESFMKLVGKLREKNKSTELKNSGGAVVDIPAASETAIPMPEQAADVAPELPVGTIKLPAFFMSQLRADGTEVYKHNIFRDEMFEHPHAYEKGEMIGLPVSHGGANCGGLQLYGKVVNGQYDMRDPDTKVSFTVNTDAIRLGIDGATYYGCVTNEAASVYKVVEKNGRREEVLVPYGDTFDIKDKLLIRVNSQWLYFTFAKRDFIPTPGGAKKAGMTIINTPAQPATQPIAQQPSAPKKMGRRKEQVEESGYRFPLDRK